jgi:hypothetical protein
MGTCNWPVDRSCLPNATGEVDQARQADAEALAVTVLWSLTGRQFGACDTIIRPCPTPYANLATGSVVGPGWFPAWVDGNWRNITCGCAGGCNDTVPSVIHLPGPAQAVTEVKIGGAVLPPDQYKLEGDRLYRVGGVAWPSQDLSRPLPEDGTWSVTYQRGVPVPDGVGVLVGTLALEFLNACTGGKCRLPRRVQSLQRQGVSYQMVDPTDIYAAGLTGIPEIDMWINSVNPRRIMAAPSVR